jgi:hypothetical protein
MYISLHEVYREILHSPQCVHPHVVLRQIIRPQYISQTAVRRISFEAWVSLTTRATQDGIKNSPQRIQRSIKADNKPTAVHLTRANKGKVMRVEHASLHEV